MFGKSPKSRSNALSKVEPGNVVLGILVTLTSLAILFCLFFAVAMVATYGYRPTDLPTFPVKVRLVNDSGEEVGFVLQESKINWVKPRGRIELPGIYHLRHDSSVKVTWRSRLDFEHADVRVSGPDTADIEYPGAKP